jgi:hypothetical protein
VCFSQEKIVMAKSNDKKTRRPVTPAPETVVAEFTLTPSRPAATGAAAPAAAPARKTYRVIRTNQLDAYDAPLPAGTDTPEALAALAPAGDNFSGTARKAAKLSIGTGAIEALADVKALIDTLTSEEDMKDHDPPITVTAGSKRVSEEQRNVRLRGFLYAASREKDNDFHLIVGRDARQQAAYMTMEVSGLPPPSQDSRDTLEQARDAYKAFFENQPNGLPGLTYDFYDPPIPVEIEGSLFFDMSHAHGPRPGPPDLKNDMPTIWEVHPITRIVFEP